MIAPRPLRGIVMVMCSTLCFAVMESLIKWLSRDYPVPLVVWARYAMQALLTIAILGPRMGRAMFATKRPGMQVVRGAVLGCSSMLMFTGLATMPLADASAISSITPILVTVLAVRFMGERAPRGAAWALALSFTGVLLVARPGSSVFNWSALFPLASAFCYCAYQLMTRKLSGVDDARATMFIGAVVATALVTTMLPFVWRPPDSARDLLLFAVIGAIGGLGHLLLVRAFEQAPASLLAPFTYVHVVFALVLGAVVFGNFPDTIALAGMALIIGAGVRMALRQRHPLPIAPVQD